MTRDARTFSPHCYASTRKLRVSKSEQEFRSDEILGRMIGLTAAPSREPRSWSGGPRCYTVWREDAPEVHRGRGCDFGRSRRRGNHNVRAGPTSRARPIMRRRDLPAAFSGVRVRSRVQTTSRSLTTSRCGRGCRRPGARRSRASWPRWPSRSGRVPEVAPCDTEAGTGVPTRDASPAGMVPALHGPPERLQLFDVIGRGGMGVVLKGYDTDLGRDLAVKVLREQFRDQPEMVRRFIEEAADRRPAPAPGGRPGLRAGEPRRSPALHRHETDPGPDPRRAARRARAGRPTTCRGSWGSSNRSARRWPMRTPAG